MSSCRRHDKADEHQWKFLTGARKAIWQLSKDGFKLPVEDNPSDKSMPISHGSKFVLVDHQGRIRGYYSPPSEREHAEKLLQDVKSLVGELQASRKS